MIIKHRALFPLAGLRSPWRLGLALVPTLGVFAARPLLPAILQQTPAVLHYPPVLLAAWLGGWWPGLISTLACSAYSIFWLRPHLLAAPLSDPPGLARTTMFLVTGIVFTILISNLQKALLEAQRTVRMRDEFLALASHELNTPLTSLKLHVGAIRRRLALGESESQLIERTGAWVQTADRQIARMERLIADMLDVPLLDAGPQILRLAPVDLSALARRVAEAFAPQAAEAGTPITVEAPVLVEGVWDAHRLEQLLGNLLSNAIKYGQARPIEVQVHARGAWARLRVRDHGIGIAPADQARIFERFERAVPYSVFQGLGLGLYLAQKIVRLQGGCIHLESALGAGACFTVELPRQPG